MKLESYADRIEKACFDTIKAGKVNELNYCLHY